MYIVKEENTLGYTLGNSDKNGIVRMVVMAVDVLKGGDPTLINRTTAALQSQCREAAEEDEQRFLFHIPSEC